MVLLVLVMVLVLWWCTLAALAQVEQCVYACLGFVDGVRQHITLS